MSLPGFRRFWHLLSTLFCPSDVLLNINHGMGYIVKCASTILGKMANYCRSCYPCQHAGDLLFILGRASVKHEHFFITSGFVLHKYINLKEILQE